MEYPKVIRNIHISQKNITERTDPKIMKKILCLFLILAVCFCFSGCGFFKFAELTAEYVAEEVGEKVTGVIDSFAELEADNKYLDELGAEIVRCFDEKDVEGLKALFCTNEKNGNPELVSEIEYAFSLYEGKSQSFNVTDKSCEGGYKDGVYYKKFFTPKIREIITDAGKTYHIELLVYTVYDNDKGKIGINALGLSDWTKNEIAEIG